MVAQNSVPDGVNDRAPTSFLGSTFGIANNDNTSFKKKREGGGGGEVMSTTHDNQQKANGARHLFGSFLNDRKKTWMTNEMAIRTQC